jgi:hypothetical protein
MSQQNRELRKRVQDLELAGAQKKLVKSTGSKQQKKVDH